MRLLILDDDEDRHRAFAGRLDGAECAHVKTYEALLQALEGPRFEGMFLDHDLGDFGESTEYTGAHCAEAIAALPPEKRPDWIVIHSWNPDGAKRMGLILADAGLRVLLRPFEFRAGETFTRVST